MSALQKRMDKQIKGLCRYCKSMNTYGDVPIRRQALQIKAWHICMQRRQFVTRKLSTVGTASTTGCSFMRNFLCIKFQSSREICQRRAEQTNMFNSTIKARPSGMKRLAAINDITSHLAPSITRKHTLTKAIFHSQQNWKAICRCH